MEQHDGRRSNEILEYRLAEDHDLNVVVDKDDLNAIDCDARNVSETSVDVMLTDCQQQKGMEQHECF